MIPTILEMLTYRRPAGSPTERAFLERYVMPWKPVVISDNLFVTVPGDPTTLFSCHTDTVHRNHAMQKVVYDQALSIAYKDDNEPLGADDTAGVWLLLEMIKAGVPGTYGFHYGEERGCIGSHAMADEAPDFLRGFKRAIAFDRKGTTSVITHQMSDRCCSAVFGTALAAALGNGYVLDPTGSYTDTASYMRIIPECTNVSVGYTHEHGPMEALDLEHLVKLRDMVLKVDWAALPTERNPAEMPTYYGEDELMQIVWDEVLDIESAQWLVDNEPDIAAQALLALADHSTWRPGYLKQPALHEEIH